MSAVEDRRPIAPPASSAKSVMLAIECCGNCSAWRAPPEGARTAADAGIVLRGLCRAHPAGLQKDFDDWCREHQRTLDGGGADEPANR